MKIKGILVDKEINGSFLVEIFIRPAELIQQLKEQKIEDIVIFYHKDLEPPKPQEKFNPQSFDAVVWAKEFMRLYKQFNNIDWVDEDLMRGWFANAIMAGYDEAKRRYEPKSQSELPEDECKEQLKKE